MRKLFESFRASRWSALGGIVLILLLAVAPAAWSRTGTAQQRQVAAGVLEVDDCKQGNWQRYGVVFKNQGDCVSYVATAGRNQPSGQANTTQSPTTTTQPAPTTTTTANRPGSKEDCKKGGWANYGVFKNQGDCVSFVATGGANPPDGA